MTVADTIDQAIAAAMLAVPGNPEIEFEPDSDPMRFPALGIIGGNWQVLEREAGLIRWQMDLTVEGFVEGGDGAAPTAERNALHAEVVASIMADDTLGGVVELIEPSDLRRSTAFLAEQRRLSFAQDFTIQFTTSRTNPALPA